MPGARGRIVRPVDQAAAFTNRQSSGIAILIDQPNLFEPPVQTVPSDSSLNPERRTLGGGRGRTLGRENGTGNGRGREPPEPRRVLPSWHPRTPLRDITNIVRPVERRRRGMGVGGEGLEIETRTQRQVGGLESQVPLSGEHNSSTVTPGPAVGFEGSFPPSAANVYRMLLDISKEEAGFITPEKKLLNSIDKVEKIMMEELQKMKNTPLAKRVEREKNVRTLMSMR